MLVLRAYNSVLIGTAGAQQKVRQQETLQAINVYELCVILQAPWGGNKSSGFGRELGEWGLENFLSVKQVTTYVSPNIWDWYSPQSKL